MSLIRAAVMASLLITLQATGRNRNILDILSLSISIIVMTDPAAAFDIGFQLSCAAMLGIILIANPEISHYARKAGVFKYIVSAVWISFAAQLATAPLCIWYFHSLALYSTLTSLFAIPITTAIIYCSIGLYLGWEFMIPVVELMLDLENTLMELVSTWPYSYITF
jgi:competence protein ComEC